MESLPPRVCALLNIAVDGARRRHADWDEIWTGAVSCGVAPTFLAALATGAADPEKCGTTVQKIEKLRAEYTISQTAKMRLIRHTAETVGALLDRNEIPFILLKGSPMAVLLMKNALYRDSNDVDIWIPETQRMRSETVLKEIGYVRAVEPHEWATNQVLLDHKIMAPVEIHWAQAPPPLRTPSFDACYDRAWRSEAAGSPAVLELTDIWVHLLFHAMDHLFALKTLLDIAAFCDIESVPAQDCHRRAAAVGMEHLSRSVYAAMAGLIRSAHRNAYTEIPTAALAIWIRDMFCPKHKRGRLIIGENSRIEAARGVIMRAGTMMMLDGFEYPVRSALNVLFCGPHKIGAAVRRIRTGTAYLFADS